MKVVTSSKKHLAVLLTLVMILSMIPMMAMADEHEMSGVAFRIDANGYWVDGVWMEADVAPYIQDGRTMVPVAHAARAIDATVEWNAENQMVTVTKGETVVTMTIGNNVKMMGEEVVVMDTVPVIKDLGDGLGRTMLPVSWLAKALDVPYTWDAETNTATFMPEAEVVVEPFVFDEAGTFGPASGTVTIDNDVIITAEDVILQNYVITGDLIIAEEVGEGDVTLNNITVEGELIVRGGGEDSIHINGGSIKTVRIEATSSGAVRIVAIDAEGMEVIVAEQAADKKIVLEGNFDKVTIEAKDVVIETRGATTIKEVVVNEESSDVSLVFGEETVVEKVVANAVVAIENNGELAEVSGDKAKESADSTTGNEPDKVTEPAAPRLTGGGGGGSSSGSTTYYAPTATNIDIIGTGLEYSWNATTRNITVYVNPGAEYELQGASVTIDRAADILITAGERSLEVIRVPRASTISVPPSVITAEVQGETVYGQSLIDVGPIEIKLMNIDRNSVFTTYTVTFEAEQQF